MSSTSTIHPHPPFSHLNRTIHRLHGCETDEGKATGTAIWPRGLGGMAYLFWSVLPLSTTKKWLRLMLLKSDRTWFRSSFWDGVSFLYCGEIRLLSFYMWRKLWTPKLTLNGCLTSSPGPALPLDFHVLAVEGDVKMESIIRKTQAWLWLREIDWHMNN